MRRWSWWWSKGGLWWLQGLMLLCCHDVHAIDEPAQIRIRREAVTATVISREPSELELKWSTSSVALLSHYFLFSPNRLVVELMAHDDIPDDPPHALAPFSEHIEIKSAKNIVTVEWFLEDEVLCDSTEPNEDGFAILSCHGASAESGTNESKISSADALQQVLDAESATYKTPLADVKETTESTHFGWYLLSTFLIGVVAIQWYWLRTSQRFLLRTSRIERQSGLQIASRLQENSAHGALRSHSSISLEECYKLLGAIPSMTDGQLRSLYREQHLSCDPDEIETRGGDCVMVELARERRKKLRLAYERICIHRDLES